MKIVCDSCATKYSISDDKVRGKVFKIRCKKCSHIIVVRGTNESAAAAAATPAATAVAADAGGWHLVVDGDQVGPVSEAEIRARVERGEVNGETYIWKEGFADWLKLSAIPELAHLATPADGGVFADGTGSGAVNGELTSHEAPAANGGGLFNGSGGEEADVFGGLAPAASKRGGGGDSFASPAVSAKPVEESRWPAPSASAAPHDGGRVENLTGQRHENSVLFSLSNLQSLAVPAPAAKASLTSTAPTTEGSGLIDIRAMAATTLGASGGGHSSFGGGSPADDLPAFGAFSPAAPVLLALPTNSGPPKWIYPVMGVAVVLLGVIGVMIYKILDTKPATVVEQAAPAAAPAAPAAAPSAPVAAATPPAATTLPAEALPPREAPKAEENSAKAEGKSDKSDKGGRHSKSDKSDKGDKGSSKKGDDKKTAAAAPALPAAAPPPAEKKPAKGSLDDLLDGALNHKSAPAAAKPRVEDDAPKAAASSGPLAKGAVVAGMNGVKGKISDCYSQFKVPGMAMVNVVIGKNGHVSSATVTGKFAGTPTGSCVEKAVKSASFPPSDGLSTPYPFQLK